MMSWHGCRISVLVLTCAVSICACDNIQWHASTQSGQTRSSTYAKANRQGGESCTIDGDCASLNCTAGRCVERSACGDGYQICNGKCAFLGYSDRTMFSNPQHCGGCGHACNDGEVCFGSQCQGCARTQTMCSMDEPNGSGVILFCADLTQDDGNCGKCGHVCPAKAPSCIHGHCEP
jgi:hypothetical protein